MNKLKFIELGVRPIFSEETISLIEGMLARKFVNFLKSGRSEFTGAPFSEYFKVEMGRASFQYQVRITLQRTDSSYFYPVETVVLTSLGSFDLEGSQVEAEKILNHMIDFQDAYWSEFFENERDTFVPLDWAENQYAGLKIFVRGSERNPYLESEAERLLAEHGFGEHDIQPLDSENDLKEQ